MRKIIIVLMCLFVIKNYTMENNSQELKRITILLDYIEGETTAPNPDAPYRIATASNLLLACSRITVASKWSQSCARANANKLVANSKKVMEKHDGTVLQVSSQMLYIYAEQIRSAIDLIDEKIKLLK